MMKLVLPLVLLAGVLVGCGSSDDAPAAQNGPVVGENNPPPEAKAAMGQTSQAESDARAAAQGGK